MAGVSDIEGLRFERGAPEAFAGRFAEIQDLRLEFYNKLLEGQRSPEEIAYFVGRLTLEKWSTPNASVGTTAKEGQRRARASVTMALDDRTNAVVGFMYAAENVSSKADRIMARLRVPRAIRTPIGDFERSKKLERGRYYIWGSEYVHDPERTVLAPITTTLNLEAYDSYLAGTWYPWDEERELKRNLAAWGYEWDRAPKDPQAGSKGFGPGTRITNQERWVVPHIGDAIREIHKIPDLAGGVVDVARSRFSKTD